MRSFIQHIIHRLEEPLPGNDAHTKMTPIHRVKTEEILASLDKVPRLSAVMVLLVPFEEEWHIVLTKRHDYDGVHSGQISFPGGKKEDIDEDLQQTALRETVEETGIEYKNIHILGALSRIYIPPSNFLVYPFIGYTEKMPAFKPDSNEVERVILVPYPHFFKPDVIKEGEFMASGNGGWKLKAPYYAFEDYRIWGATAAILSEFAHIARG